MALKWFAILCSLPTKEKIEERLVEAGFKKEFKYIKKILTFDFERDSLWLEHDDSILNGYALIQINTKQLPEIMKMVDKSRIGSFFNTGKNKLPFPIPDDQVKEFKKRVGNKKREFYLEEQVFVTAGIFNGMNGVVKGKKRLMLLVQVELPHRTVRKWVNIMEVLPGGSCKTLN